MAYRAVDPDHFQKLMERGHHRAPSKELHPFFASLQKESFISAPGRSTPSNLADQSVGRISDHQATKGTASPNEWYRKNAWNLRTTPKTPTSTPLSPAKQTRNAQAAIARGMTAGMTPNKGNGVPRKMPSTKVPTHTPGAANVEMKLPTAPTLKTSGAPLTHFEKTSAVKVAVWGRAMQWARSAWGSAPPTRHVLKGVKFNPATTSSPAWMNSEMARRSAANHFQRLNAPAADPAWKQGLKAFGTGALNVAKTPVRWAQSNPWKATAIGTAGVGYGGYRWANNQIQNSNAAQREYSASQGRDYRNASTQATYHGTAPSTYAQTGGLQPWYETPGTANRPQMTTAQYGQAVGSGT